MNLGLLGAINGLGQGMQTVGAGMVKQQEDIDKEQRSLILGRQLQQDRFDLEDARAKRLAGEVTVEANRLAGERASGLLSSARQAYADAGMADDPAVVQGLDQAQAEQSVPTLRDRVQAKANLGQGGELDLLRIDADERRSKKAEDETAATNRRLELTAMRDAARNALAERKLDIDSKKVDAMIAGIGAWAKSTSAGGAQTTAMIQNYAELEKRGYSKDQIEKILFEGKPPAESFEETTKIDPLTGKPVVSVKRRGGGAPPAADVPTGNPDLDLTKFLRK